VLDGRRIVWTDCYHCAYTMRIEYRDSAEDAKNYIRQTDFSTGEVNVSWDTGGSHFVNRTFVSRPDRVIVQQIERDDGPVNIAVSLHATGDGLFPNPVDLTEQWLSFRFKYDENHRRGYAGFTRMVPFGGKTVGDGDSVVVSGAKKVLLLTRIESVEDYDTDATGVEERTRAELAGLPTDFDRLLKRHAGVHGPIFDRCLVDLDPGQDLGLSNEELLAKQVRHVPNDKLNRALTQKLYEMGRYAFISSAGEWPQNLTALWSGSVRSLPPAETR